MIQDFDFRLLGHPRDDPCPVDEEYNKEVVFVNGSNTLNWIRTTEYGVTQSWTRLALIPRQGVNPLHSHCLRPLYISENDVLLAIAPYHKLVLRDLNNDDGNFVPVIGDGGAGEEEDWRMQFQSTFMFMVKA
ncbi:hypothetical protein PIB30_006664 [Stylosanthes scabra]|uniref:Uncharacterized protein n=1 Tax=Stylosanthes scabra TaxID=79078 RepID=A0ABU6R5L3_9FABA|nr:hypothetical protein [Stylosanthes scabra]